MPRPQLILFVVSFLLIAKIDAQNLFEEVSVIKGLTFDYQESLKMGGGAATFDFDNDGDEDIYIVGGKNPDGLFENDGAGKFTDISISTNITTLTEGLMTTSVITGDIDNDGVREIFVGTIGEIETNLNAPKPNLILRFNPSTSKFDNITESTGIADESFCMGAHFFDSNLDGLLDLYLINYVSSISLIQDGSEVIGFDHECFENKLYINIGNNKFIDRTSFYGLDQVGCSLAATSADLDLDGDSDLIVANDFGKWLQPNQLYQNEGADLPYSDISASSNTNAQMYAMGIAVGDYDEDLDLDFYVTNIGANHFFENMGGMNFQDKAEELNIQNTKTENDLFTTGWGALLGDFNNDSYLDLLVSNGYVYSVVDVDDTYQYDEFYLGTSEHKFQNATSECGINFQGPSRGALKGDWNNDGRLDLITITNEKLFPSIINSVNYYLNTGNQGNWVGFKLTGTISNRDAFGAKIYVHSGDRTFLKEIRGGDSHASQSSSILHFGLADMQVIDSILIFWPSGIIEKYQDFDINTYHHLQEGTTSSVSAINEEIDVNVFPNPTINIININLKEEIKAPFELKIFNSIGMQVFQKHMTSQYNQIDISSLQRGLYTLICRSDSKVQSKQIIILQP